MDTTSLARQLAQPDTASPIRYATVISINGGFGTVVVRPSNATKTDGSQDVTARVLNSIIPNIGTTVRIEVFSGDVLVLGMVARPVWQTYTPTLTVFTLGNGTIKGRFSLSGGTVNWKARMVFGTTSAAATGNPTITLPLAGSTASSLNEAESVRGTFVNASGFPWDAGCYQSNLTVSLWILGTSGAYGGLTATTPFTWAANCVIDVGGSYEAA